LGKIRHKNDGWKSKIFMKAHEIYHWWELDGNNMKKNQVKVENIRKQE
jgi:hypothetical protein